VNATVQPKVVLVYAVSVKPHVKNGCLFLDHLIIVKISEFLRTVTGSRTAIHRRPIANVVKSFLVGSSGCGNKKQSLGKNSFCLQNRGRLFHQIYVIYREECKPHILQISLQYLIWFKYYNYFNVTVHFSKLTCNCTAILT